MTRETPGAVVGIDLGTTYSLVATMIGGVPTVLANAVGEKLTPSAVSLTDDGRVLVGAVARARATTHPTRTALTFKRDMGTGKVYDLEAQKMTPQELSALVLRSLRQDAEAALGVPIAEAVVTVPAYFGEQQREATRAAAAIAGLKVERIINEPTAAAIAYGLHQRNRELKAVVLDLGGGTFDVTVLEILEGVIEIQSSAGDSRLGGEDFTDALAAMYADHLQAKHGHDVRKMPKGWARVREACEDAKRRLTSQEHTSLPLPLLPLAPGVEADVDWTLTRERAEEAWAPTLERLRAPILRALRDASLPPDRVDEVLLVGGATRMPIVVRLTASIFGRMPNRSLPPDEAIALGAAAQAALQVGDASVEDLVTTDVAPFSMGIETSVGLGSQRMSGVFSPVLERGTVIPTSRVERFQTCDDFQKEIRIKVYQGEHSLCRDNHFLGDYVVKDLPPAPAGETSIDVRFTYDLNGLLEVETTVVGTAKQATLVLEKTPGRLKASEIAEAQERMKRLKFHPRDALPNTTALERAEALFVELTGAPRSEVGSAIAALRVALDAQDDELITQQRSRLLALIARYRR